MIDWAWCSWLPIGIVRVHLDRRASRVHMSFRGNTRRAENFSGVPDPGGGLPIGGPGG